jgi:hypothetical protein
MPGEYVTLPQVYDVRIVHVHCTEAEFLDLIWDKGLKSVPPCYSQTPLLTDFTLPTPTPQPLSKSGLKLVCNTV